MTASLLRGATWLGLGLAGLLGLAACGTTTTTGSTTTTTGSTTTTTAAKSSASITSATVTGTVAAPVITVAGTGFGSEPSPGPVPQGQQGCPSAPASGDGNLFNGMTLFFSNTHAKTGSFKNWNAGQYTPGSNGQFDCVGLIISSWSPTKVVFGFGNLYNKNLPMNYYVLSNGDTFKLYVRGASSTGTAALSG
ncbi:MAG: hypothetical protein ACRDWV_04980 [Acidimicrobiales bacterium]